jgi:hypothetical protein
MNNALVVPRVTQARRAADVELPPVALSRLERRVLKRHQKVFKTLKKRSAGVKPTSTHHRAV